MALTRVHPLLNLVLIRRLGDTGGPRHDQVADELDNIIDFVNGLPRVIHRNFAATGNVGTGLDTLHSYTLDSPNRLLTNGDMVRAEYGGSLTSNANDKRLKLNFGGQTVFDSTLRALRGGPWRAVIDYARTDNTHVRASGVVVIDSFICNEGPAIDVGSNTEHLHFPVNTLLTVAALDANSMVMSVEGETSAASNDDAVQNFSRIEICLQ